MLLKKRTERKIVVVTRETRVDDLRKRFNTIDQAAFFVKKRGGKFEDYLEEDACYKQAIQQLEDGILEWGNVQFIDRSYLPNFVFGPEDTVIAIGQDGLVANTLKYLRTGQPLIGVNPDPGRWDGVLLPFQVGELSEVVGEVLSGKYRAREVTMATARLNDGQEILAVNDLFVGPRSHTSARYILEIDGLSERQSSSGIIVSTGLGSTGWLKSLVSGAESIFRKMNGISEDEAANLTIPWESPELQFTVREPFPSRTTLATLVFGRIRPGHPLMVRSLMPENGVIFSDGIESDFLEFNSGSEVTITSADSKGRLVVG